MHDAIKQGWRAIFYVWICTLILRLLSNLSSIATMKVPPSVHPSARRLLGQMTNLDRYLSASLPCQFRPAPLWERDRDTILDQIGQQTLNGTDFIASWERRKEGEEEDNLIALKSQQETVTAKGGCVPDNYWLCIPAHFYACACIGMSLLLLLPSACIRCMASPTYNTVFE
jgi:hypothetical protein